MKRDFWGVAAIIALGLFLLPGCALFKTPKTIIVYECNKCVSHFEYCSFNGDQKDEWPCWVVMSGYDKSQLRFCEQHKEHGRLYHGQE